jgi:hypothetical protein
LLDFDVVRTGGGVGENAVVQLGVDLFISENAIQPQVQVIDHLLGRKNLRVDHAERIDANA